MQIKGRNMMLLLLVACDVGTCYLFLLLLVGVASHNSNNNDNNRDDEERKGQSSIRKKCNTAAFQSLLALGERISRYFTIKIM